MHPHTETPPTEAGNRSEDERSNKIRELNERLRSSDYFKIELLLDEDATNEQIEATERAVTAAEISRRVPLGTPERNRVIEQEIVRVAATHSPLRRLKDLFATAEERRAAAHAANTEAAIALSQVEALHRQYEGVKSNLETARANLARARTDHTSLAEEFARLDNDDALTNRFVDFSTRVPDVTALAREVESNRAMLGYVLGDWPRVEKTLVARVEKLEADLAKIEGDFTA